MKGVFITAMVLLLTVSVCFDSLLAQSFFLQSSPLSEHQIIFKYLNHPLYYDEQLSTFSGIYDFHFNFSVSNKFNFVLSIPYLVINFPKKEYYYNRKDYAGVGNLYTGFQYCLNAGNNKIYNIELGVYLLAMNNQMSYMISNYGRLANYYNFPKYSDIISTIYSNFSYRSFKSRGLIYGFEVGPQMLVADPTSGLEYFIHYACMLGYHVGIVLISSEFLGMVYIDKKGDYLPDNLMNELLFGLQITKWDISPGIFFKIPIFALSNNELSRPHKAVIGVKLDIIL